MLLIILYFETGGEKHRSSATHAAMRCVHDECRDVCCVLSTCRGTRTEHHVSKPTKLDIQTTIIYERVTRYI